MKMAKVGQIKKLELCIHTHQAMSYDKKKGSTFTRKPLTHIIAAGDYLFIFLNVLMKKWICLVLEMKGNFNETSFKIWNV